MADVVLDFDACKSVVKRGNSGQYNLKPVIAVTPLLSDAGLRVIGFVDPAIAPRHDERLGASARRAGEGDTRPDRTAGSCSIPCRSAPTTWSSAPTGRVTAVMTGVPVIDDGVHRRQQQQRCPIAPPTPRGARGQRAL